MRNPFRTSILVCAFLSMPLFARADLPTVPSAAPVTGTAKAAGATAKATADTTTKAASAKADSTATAAKDKAAGAEGAAKDKAAAVKGKLLDLNTATKEELDALPGIGEVYSQKILDGRPYANKAQLVSKKILPAGVYDKVKTLVVAKKAPKAATTPGTVAPTAPATK